VYQCGWASEVSTCCCQTDQKPNVTNQQSIFADGSQVSAKTTPGASTTTTATTTTKDKFQFELPSEQHATVHDELSTAATTTTATSAEGLRSKNGLFVVSDRGRQLSAAVLVDDGPGDSKTRGLISRLRKLFLHLSKSVFLVSLQFF